jgi:hypothetical protein
MDSNDQLTDHQGLVDRINIAAEKARVGMDQADRTAADGGTHDLTGLRAAINDIISAAHGFEALFRAGVTPKDAGASSDDAAATAAKDDKAAAKPSGSASSSGSSGSGSTAKA